MCAVSYVAKTGLDYAHTNPLQHWTPNYLDAYRKLFEAAREFDNKTGQPNCEDPEKAKFEKQILDRLEAIEKKLEGR